MSSSSAPSSQNQTDDGERGGKKRPAEETIDGLSPQERAEDGGEESKKMRLLEKNRMRARERRRKQKNERVGAKDNLNRLLKENEELRRGNAILRQKVEEAEKKLNMLLQEEKMFTAQAAQMRNTTTTLPGMIGNTALPGAFFGMQQGLSTTQAAAGATAFGASGSMPPSNFSLFSGSPFQPTSTQAVPAQPTNQINPNNSVYFQPQGTVGSTNNNQELVLGAQAGQNVGNFRSQAVPGSTQFGGQTPFSPNSGMNVNMGSNTIDTMSGANLSNFAAAAGGGNNLSGMGTLPFNVSGAGGFGQGGQVGNNALQMQAFLNLMQGQQTNVGAFSNPESNSALGSAFGQNANAALTSVTPAATQSGTTFNLGNPFNDGSFNSFMAGAASGMNIPGIGNVSGMNIQGLGINNMGGMNLQGMGSGGMNVPGISGVAGLSGIGTQPLQGGNFQQQQQQQQGSNSGRQTGTSFDNPDSTAAV